MSLPIDEHHSYTSRVIRDTVQLLVLHSVLSILVAVLTRTRQ